LTFYSVCSYILPTGREVLSHDPALLKKSYFSEN